MIVRLPYSLPLVRLEAEQSPIETRNGGNLWQLPSGWAVFVAHTRGASALLDASGKVRLLGAWTGSGRFDDGFSGTTVAFGDSKRREALLRRAGVETVPGGSL